ncbi:MAG: LolA-like putative outer membrane lipoprotein chaperone [Bacteroidaceae bacterium]
MTNKKRGGICLIIILFSLSLCAQQDKQAKKILDKTSAVFQQAKGINAGFYLENTSKSGKKIGEGKGTIRIKGNQFVMDSEGITTWFDGKTQWSYVAANEEVNISNPSPEELQSINPYTLLNLYRQGFNYQYNGIKTRGGRQGYEIRLIPQNKKQEMSSIILFVTKTYQPYYIEVRQKDGATSEITATTYQTGLLFEDSFFRFDNKKYPKAEMIDLR